MPCCCLSDEAVTWHFQNFDTCQQNITCFDPLQQLQERRDSGMGVVWGYALLILRLDVPSSQHLINQTLLGRTPSPILKQLTGRGGVSKGML